MLLFDSGNIMNKRLIGHCFKDRYEFTGEYLMNKTSYIYDMTLVKVVDVLDPHMFKIIVILFIIYHLL